MVEENKWADLPWLKVPFCSMVVRASQSRIRRGRRMVRCGIRGLLAIERDRPPCRVVLFSLAAGEVAVRIRVTQP